MSEVNITPPVPHPNGTDQGSLLEASISASVALMEAIVAVGEMAPSALDFVGYGPDWRDTVARAESEHAARVGTLKMILCEVEALACAISDMNLKP